MAQSLMGYAEAEAVKIGIEFLYVHVVRDVSYIPASDLPDVFIPDAAASLCRTFLRFVCIKTRLAFRSNPRRVLPLPGAYRDLGGCCWQNNCDEIEASGCSSSLGLMRDSDSLYRTVFMMVWQYHLQYGCSGLTVNG